MVAHVGELESRLAEAVEELENYAPGASTGAEPLSESCAPKEL